MNTHVGEGGERGKDGGGGGGGGEKGGEGGALVFHEARLWAQAMGLGEGCRVWPHTSLLITISSNLQNCNLGVRGTM